jgi:hypothetical protein
VFSLFSVFCFTISVLPDCGKIQFIYKERYLKISFPPASFKSKISTLIAQHLCENQILSKAAIQTGLIAFAWRMESAQGALIFL